MNINMWAFIISLIAGILGTFVYISNHALISLLFTDLNFFASGMNLTVILYKYYRISK